MRKLAFQSYVEQLYREAPRIPFTDQDRIVVFSDLHIGDGSRDDDFYGNGAEFARILENYYYKNNYRVLLNGDIEELMRFSHETIVGAWPGIYAAFDKFDQEGRLHRIIGNHDYFYSSRDLKTMHSKPQEAFVLTDGNRELFVLHGHQSRTNYTNKYLLVSFILRYLARPLKIKNYTVAYNNRKKFGIEAYLYEFARIKKIAVILGHTHRPLFESLSEKDNLKFQIEKLCRRHSKAADPKKEKIAARIQACHAEFAELLEDGAQARHPGSLYDMDNLVPCLFNSGSGIGKSGITAIEITRGEIALIHWLNPGAQQRLSFLKKKKIRKESGCSYLRAVVNKDDLEYIFTRIRLLS